MIFLLAGKLLKLLSKISKKRGYSYVSEMSEEDAVRNVDYLAHALRKVTKGGAGISIFPIRLALSGCRKVTLQKQKRNIRLFGFERWIKENYRLISSMVSEVARTDFGSLPHVDGVPRVVILADFLVKYSGGKLSYDKVEKIMRAFRAVTPLSYPEIEALKSALAYRLLFELSLFAERSVVYYKEYLKAEKRKFSEKHARSDSYLSFYASMHAGELDSLGIGRDPKAATLGFENLLADNETLTSVYVNSLRVLPDFTDVSHLVPLSAADEIFQKEEEYRHMSDAAKREYLLKCHESALRLSVEEWVVAKSALFLGEKHGVHFGEILYHYPKALRRYLKNGSVQPLTDEKSGTQGFYCFSVFALSVIVAAIPAYFLRNLWGYLSVLPLFIASLHPVEYMVKKFVSMRVKSKPIPQMNYEILPEKCRTVVVTSRFLATKKDVDDALLQAETLAASERDQAISFVILADFPSSEELVTEMDEELLDYIRKAPRSDRISFLVRKRKKKGDRFVAYERKRGAILDLFRAMKEKNFDGFYLFGTPPKAEWAILLDDDSEVVPGTIKAAIQAMAHPLNKEYDLMSFGGRYNRFSLRTHYGLRFLRSCGVDAYPHYSDFYFDAFDSALYCGKAIVRISSYLSKLDGFFPDDRILSHDIIEGAVLRSASLKRCVYEDVPATFAGDHLRTSRWQRGDVQLLPYALCAKVKDREKKRVKNPIASVYKLIIFINGFSVLRELMTLSVLILAYFSGTRLLFYYALSAHLFTKVYALIAALRTLFTPVRISHALRTVVSSLELLTEEFLLLPFRALSGGFLFFGTLFKMTIKSKTLLDWKPFRTTQGTGGAADGAKLLLPTVILLSAVTILAGDLVITCYACLFFLFSFYLLLSGKSISQIKMKARNESAMREYAQKIYRYFADFSDEGLLPDNIRFFPYEAKAKMTSPTNLGFAILSEVCAVKLGLVEREKGIKRIRDLFEKTQKLEKWKGHLFNWYDVMNFRVMQPRVVSTVDSANFIACLTVAEVFLREEGESELSEEIGRSIKDTDFTALFDKEKKFLVIVHSVEEKRNFGYYDLLASEARLAYYFAIGQGVDAECYFRLGRDCASFGGNTLLSWSGTAFEYMLPRLFLKPPIGSLLAEQEYRSGIAEQKESTHGVFGKSECGYADFDNSTAYRYKAVGCASLALSEESADVIAPYATFLYLPLFPQACLSNLSRLRKLGLEGKYGFYEAMDFEKGESVKSFMTHHQGMSLAALTNVLCNEEIVRLFSASPNTRAFRLLLTEENIHARVPKRFPERKEPTPRREPCLSECKKIPDTLVIKSGSYSAMYDALGRSYAKFDKFYLTKYRDYLKERGGIFVQIKEDGCIHSPCYFPAKDPEVYALFEERSVRYVDPKRGTTLEVYPLEGFDGELRTLTLNNDGDSSKTYEVSVYADMMLNDKDAYDSHPAYSDMFVFSEYDDRNGTQYLYRKNAECEISVAASFSVKGLVDLKANGNSYNVIGRKGSLESDFADGIKKNDAPPFGDVLYPCFAATGKITVSPHEKGRVYFCLFGGKDLAQLKERDKKVHLAYLSGSIELLGKREGTHERVDLALFLKTCGALLHGRATEDSLEARYSGKEELLKFGVRAEDPILYFDVTKDFVAERIRSIAVLSAHLKVVGIPHVLAVLCEKIEGAGMNSVAALERIFEEENAERRVFPERENAELFHRAARLDLSLPFEEGEPISEVAEVLPEQGEQEAVIFRTGEGWFTKCGYRVNPFGEQTLLPYANIVGCEKGGFVITESGGGFTFGSNSREEKITFWSGDALRDPQSERVLLRLGDKNYLLNTLHCEHRVGSSEFRHIIEGINVTLKVSCAFSGKSKVYEVIIGQDLPQDSALIFSLLPALGWRFSDRVFAEKEERGFRLICSDTGKTAYLSFLEGRINHLPCSERSEFLSFETDLPLKKGIFRFLLSSEAPEKVSDHELTLSKAKTLCEVSKNIVEVQTGVPALDLLYNRVLPYQTLSARLNAKTGFYQCGGAVGFRDQLQDSLALLLSDPDRVKKQILTAAAHQYEEGDVQHWWHPPRMGVRTRISDDRLWLVYLTSRYLEVTGDHAVLDEKIPFLHSVPLAEKEISRYEIPQEKTEASLKEHLRRAIDVSLVVGEHGLLKIGSGDWNDGLDRVGVKGKGESVWLTMFACKVISDAIILFDPEERKRFADRVSALRSALIPLFKEGRYPLAFTDDGKWLGYRDTPACTLALNPQSWAVLCEALPSVDAERAILTAEDLFDRLAGIIKLSVPPFDSRANYGYISAYPKGVRENGGQYTHAAVWYLKALIVAGEKDKAYRLLSALNPLARCVSEEESLRYKGEPYVLAGDVYGYEPYRGRAGWTWYTGSAGWLKYVLTEDFFGLRKRGDYLYVEPCFPSSFTSLRVEIRFPKRLIRIEYCRSRENALYRKGEKIEKVDLRDEEKVIDLLCHFC